MGDCDVKFAAENLSMHSRTLHRNLMFAKFGISSTRVVNKS